MINSYMRNQVESDPRVNLKRRLEASQITSHTKPPSSTLCAQGRFPLPTDAGQRFPYANTIAPIDNKTGDIVTDVTNSEINYIKELKGLCVREYTSIEFDTNYSDVVQPTDTAVLQILERTTRFVCKAHKTRIVNVAENKATLAYRKVRQTRGMFGNGDVELYLHEFEQVMASQKLTLAPFARDRILNTWKELLRCYNETKTIDRLNDYVVTIGIGVSTQSSDDWKLFVTAKSKSVDVDNLEARWTTLEYNEYLFT